MSCLLALFVLVFSNTAVAETADSVVRLQFNPPEQPFVRVFELEIEHEVDGETVSSSRIENVRDLRFFMRGNGWRLVSLPHLTEITGTISPMERKVQEILMEQTLVWHFDEDGGLLDCGGFEDVGQRAADAFPQPMPETVLPILNRDTQRWRLRDRWERAYGWLYGQDLRPGEPYVMETVLHPPDAPPMAFTQTSHIRDLEGDRLTIDYEAVATSLAKDTPDPAGQLEIEEQGTRLFDLSTGQSIEETQVKTIRFTTPRADGSSTVETRRERTRIHYRFADAITEIPAP